MTGRVQSRWDKGWDPRPVEVEACFWVVTSEERTEIQEDADSGVQDPETWNYHML